MPFPTGDYLVDTSSIVRLDEPNSPKRIAVMDALRAIAEAGDTLHIAPQSLIEFWNVSTRPKDRNGLGLSPAQAAARVGILKSQFRLLPDVSTIHDEWERLATMAQLSGRQVHDMRLAAFMVVHQIPNLLTLNPSDFHRFTALTGIVVVEPGSIL